jgi:hypothetical protein
MRQQRLFWPENEGPEIESYVAPMQPNVLDKPHRHGSLEELLYFPASASLSC